MSRADKSVTRCSFEIDIDPATQLPRSIQMTVLSGVRGATSEEAKGDKSFAEGIEHVAFHFSYDINTNETVKFKVPRAAAKLMK